MTAGAYADTAMPPGSADAGTVGMSRIPAQIDIDMPELPLDKALLRYSEQAGRSVLYETSLVAGKRAGALRGRFDSDEALARLLAGSGLTVRRVRDRSVMLVPRPAMPGGEAALQRYDAQVRLRIAQALCRHPETEPGRHRMAMRFDVTEERRIADLRVRIQASRALEPAVRRALTGLHVGRPPEGSALPIVVVVSPVRGEACGQ